MLAFQRRPGQGKIGCARLFQDGRENYAVHQVIDAPRRNDARQSLCRLRQRVFATSDAARLDMIDWAGVVERRDTPEDLVTAAL